MSDTEQIAVVRALCHRVAGMRSSCKCEECAAIRRVCTLAEEAVAMKAARLKGQRKRRKCAQCGYRADQMIHNLTWDGAHEFVPDKPE
jgi:hypothetical protein